MKKEADTNVSCSCSFALNWWKICTKPEPFSYASRRFRCYLGNSLQMVKSINSTTIVDLRLLETYCWLQQRCWWITQLLANKSKQCLVLWAYLVDVLHAYTNLNRKLSEKPVKWEIYSFRLTHKSSCYSREKYASRATQIECVYIFFEFGSIYNDNGPSHEFMSGDTIKWLLIIRLIYDCIN